MSNLKKLTQQLYPTGRAHKFPFGGVKDKFHDAIIEVESQVWSDNLATLDIILPDNNNFSEQDATRWEEMLGMITSTVSLADRKLAIIRKMNHPGVIPARQNFGYLQDQLQAAGFDVYVHENIFSDGMGGFQTLSPTDILGNLISGIWDYGAEAEYGEVEYGNPSANSVWEDCVANYIDEDLDKWFNVGANLRNTFYISGAYIDNFVSVPLVRRDEFRQLILKLKPTQTIAFLFVNYTT